MYCVSENKNQNPFTERGWLHSLGREPVLVLLRSCFLSISATIYSAVASFYFPGNLVGCASSN
jgi:hypothetical protein